MMIKKKRGDPISAADWNAVVKAATREVKGRGVTSDEQGWTLPSETRQPPQLHEAVIVCQGPDGEANPTDEMYWIQFAQATAALETVAPEYDVDENEIVPAFNKAEVPYHTHGLRVGQPVDAWLITDAGGRTRWVFAMMPLILAMFFGSLSNAFGSAQADNWARLDSDSWSADLPLIPFGTDSAVTGIGTTRDTVWFEGTYWIAGSLTMPSNGGGMGVGLAYYDWDTSAWVGVLLGADETGGEGFALQVWDDGVNGEQLYYSQLGGSGGALTDVVSIDFDQETKTVTVNDLGWIADVGTGCLCHRFFVWGDGESEAIVCKNAPGGFINTWGQETNTSDETQVLDGSIHLVETEFDGGTQWIIDGYYEFSTTGFDVPTTVTWKGYLNFSNGVQDILVQVWNWGAAAWDTLDTVLSTSGTPLPVHEWSITEDHIGTGGDAGDVRIRFYRTAVFADKGAALRTDHIYLSSEVEGRDKLWCCGFFTSGAAAGKNGIVVYDGVSFDGVGGGLDSNADGIHGMAEHDFGDGEGPKLAVVGKFAGIGSVGDTLNVAAWYPSGATWQAIGEGVALAANTANHDVESFNNRLWVAAGFFDPGQPFAQGGNLLAWDNETTLWTNAADIIKELERGWGGDPPDGFWTYTWNGSTSTPEAASISSLATYQGRLILGGGQNFYTKRRGRNTTGPFAYVNEDEDVAGVYYRVRRMIRGEVFASCAYGGEAVAGGRFRLGLTGGLPLANIGGWRDPADPTVDGEWNTFDGGVEGTVFAVCVWNGDLYVAGDITFAGSGQNRIAVKGIARWDGQTWNYVVNASDYGTIRAMIVFNDRLIIAGDFTKIDGAPSKKIMVAWNGYTAEALASDWDALDGLPIVRALATYNGVLYAGGWFDTVDGVTCRNVAQMDSAETWDALRDVADSLEGLTGQVYSIAAFTQVGTAEIFFGCQKDTEPYGGGPWNGQSVWRWTPGAPDGQWELGITNVDTWGETAVYALEGTPDLDHLYLGTELLPLPGFELGGPKFTVWHWETGGSLDRLAGLDGQADAVIRTITYADAGDGRKPYVGGVFGAIGTVNFARGHPCQLVVAVDEQDHLIDIAGGLGVGGYAAQFTSAQRCLRLREITFPDGICSSLMCLGFFGMTNEGYSEYGFATDLAGRPHPLQGGVHGNRRGSLSGMLDGILCWAFEPSPTPPQPADDDVCEPYDGFHAIFGGSFSHILNSRIADADIDDIEDVTPVHGIAGYWGGYLRKVVASAPGGFGGEAPTAMAWFEGKLHVTSDAYVPERYTGDADSGSWAVLANPEVDGNLTFDFGAYFSMIVWDDQLWFAGDLRYFGVASPISVPFTVWDGSYTQLTPVGFAASDADRAFGRDFAIADLGGGKRLYACGTPTDPTINSGGDNPVIEQTATGTPGTWAALGGSTLRGEAYAIAAVHYEDSGAETLVFAVGLLGVWVGPGADDYEECNAASYSPSSGTWSVIGAFGSAALLDQGVLVADDQGYGPGADAQRSAIFGGGIGEAADQQADEGTTASRWAANLAHYRGSTWVLNRLSTNGPILSAASAWPLIVARGQP